VPYVVTEHYLAGMPQTILPEGLAARGIAYHWTAGGTGIVGAKATATFLVSAAQRNASYHEIWWWESSSQTFGVLLLVRNNRAAHSMNPNQPPTGPWNPNPEVRRILGDKWWNPNSFSRTAAFAGGPRDLELALREPAFVRHAARRTRDIMAEESGLAHRPFFNHGWGQPNKADAGPALIPALYQALAAGLPNTGLPTEEDEMEWAKHIRAKLVSARLGPNQPIRDRPDISAAYVTHSTGPSGFTARVIGEVDGSVHYGDKTWYVYALNAGGLRTFHKSQVVSEAPIAATDTTAAFNQGVDAAAQAALSAKKE
jgi:hypothetical protein